jgi:hypothetical protein
MSHVVITAMPCSYLQKLFNLLQLQFTSLSLPGGLPPEDQCLVFQKFFLRPVENVIKLFIINGKKAQEAEASSTISNGSKEQTKTLFGPSFQLQVGQFYSVTKKMHSMHMVTSKVKKPAQVLSCKLKFAHG